MFPYAGYDFYKLKTNGTLDETLFNAEILKASFFLRYLTMGKSDITQPEELLYCACAIADMYHSEKQKATSGNGRMKSENTDGYSVSYVVEIKDGESLEELLNRKASDIARKYLFNTGLLNRKVGCCHVNKCGLYDL